MALTLVKEDGSGLSNANSYANETDGDSYHDGHSYATDWTGATSGAIEAALVHATRLLDDYINYTGRATSDTQALDFPRFDIKDESGFLIESTTIPQSLINATCELARWIIGGDRTAEEGEMGFSQLSAGSLSMTVEASDRKAVIPDVVLKMISSFGTSAGGAMAKVSR